MTPVMIPVPEPTLTVVVEALLHVPPGDASATEAIVPGQRLPAPVMASGAAFTVVVLDAGSRPVQP